MMTTNVTMVQSHATSTKQSGPGESSDRTCVSSTTNNDVGGSSSTMSRRENQQNQQVQQYCQPGKLTKTVNSLRAAVMILFISTATMVCVGVYKYTKEGETLHFEQDFEDNALRIVTAFHDATERKLGATNTLSMQITAYALDTNQTFPFVTIPNFAIRGSDLRISANSMIVHWMPLVTDSNRIEWERYAMDNRHHIDVEYEADKDQRDGQDDLYGLLQDEDIPPFSVPRDDNDNGNRKLKSTPSSTSSSPRIINETVLDDGTGYHPRIWSIGGIDPRGDYANGTGPYLPLWQRSPVSSAKQSLLNMNFGKSRALAGALDVILATKQAVMNAVSFPIPAIIPIFKANLEISQYRHDVEEILQDPFTFIAYPVFDSFDHDHREVVGTLATNIYWKLFFQNILQPSATSTICVLENSFNDTFSYLIEGPDPTYLGKGDHHDPTFNYLEYSADFIDVEETAGPKTRSYTAVPLNRDYGSYRLRIYPAYSQEFSDRPWLYTGVVAATFAFTAIIFILFSYAVEKRQKLVMESAIHHEKRAATAARELNEFLSHEVRNPLSAAIAATTFVKSTLMETTGISDAELKQSLQDDVKIISTSLSFVSDFLRSVLDLHRAEGGHQIKVHASKVDIRTDVLEPISNMFFQRNSGVKIIVDCPTNLVVMTDCLRLKQVILNLGRNSAKFVEVGFIRFRAEVVNSKVEIYVEDSGPGIPIDKQDNLFQKFQTSLDVLHQGTGVGLSLCKMLVDLLDGDIYLDASYDSGTNNSPGARFVVRLNTPLLHDPSDETSCQLSRLSRDKTAIEENAFAANGPCDQGVVNNDSISLPDHMSVMFVDDDRMLRKLFVRAIKKVAPQWTIHEAANGETAIQMVNANNKFDLIFIDQYMSSTEKTLLGTETTRELRSIGVTSIICGLSANDIEDSFITAGANAFIMKPLPCDKDKLSCELMRMLHDFDDNRDDIPKDLTVFSSSDEDEEQIVYA